MSIIGAIKHLDGEWKLKNCEFTDVYTDLKRKLIEKGIPENEIAFIHDANNEVKKQVLRNEYILYLPLCYRLI